MVTPLFQIGDCVCCRARNVELRRRKVFLSDDIERWLWTEHRGRWAWVCAECRKLDRREMRERIEHSLTLPILPNEKLILRTSMPTAEDYAAVQALADVAREALRLIDLGEMDAAAEVLAVLAGEEVETNGK